MPFYDFNTNIINARNIQPQLVYLNYIYYKSNFIYKTKFNFIKRNNIFYFFIKKLIFNNNFLFLLKNNFFSNFWLNRLLVNYQIFNCCFYNFYLENNFLFFKIHDVYNNFYFMFLVKFFKKKKNKPIKKKKFFKFRKKRFKFKKLRRYFKNFKFKKSKIKNEKILDLNFSYFYNYLIKIKKKKILKIKKINLFSHNKIDIENIFIKKKIKTTIYLFKHSFIYDYNSYLLRFKKFYFFFKKSENFNFLKKVFCKLNQKKIKKFFLKKNYFVTFFLNYFCKNLIKKNFYKNNLYFLQKYVSTDYLSVFSINNSYNFINFLKIKKRKNFKRKKKFFFFKTKFFKLKKKYKYKIRYLYFNKLNIKKNKPLLDRSVYKLLLVSLINSFKLNFSFFNFNNLGKYSFYIFFFLKNQKRHLKKFFKKNLFFFDLLKKINNNKNLIYNNQYPIYNSNKVLLKSFKKIFKSFFNKKFNNYLYFYVIPLFEYFFNKNVFIKSINSNIFKKKKSKKKFFIKKLIKIYKKNKFSVISRSITFNLYEIIEVILYSFYYKDIFILNNWFLKNFKNIHFTNHKNFLVFFKIILNDIFESYRDALKIKGFYFKIKGKIGVTSNAKKKTVKFIIGSSKKSQKSQKMDFQQGVVKSLSGSLGVSMILTY